MYQPSEPDFLFAATNIPPALGVVLDQPLPNPNPAGGAFGRIYIGTRDGRRVAVKVQTCSSTSRNEVMFMQTIRAAAAPCPPPMLPNLYADMEHTLTHPNGAVRQWHYIVMDGFSGDGEPTGWLELFDHLAAGRFMGIGAELQAAEMFVQMLLAILFMHSCDLAHFDIKPDNTMYTPAGNPNNLPEVFPWKVAVIDFGMATIIDPRRPKATGGQGTYAYKAPEVGQMNQHVTLAADIWSLAVTLFVAVANCRPFLTSSTIDDRQGHVPDRRQPRNIGTGNFQRLMTAQQTGESSTSAIFGGYQRVSPFSPPLNRLLDRMFTIDVAQRPNIVQVLLLALEWVHSLPAAADPPPPWLRAAEAAAAVGKDPRAIAAAVYAHAPGSSAQHAAMPATAAAAALPDPPAAPEADAAADAVMDAAADGAPPEPAPEATASSLSSEAPSAEELHEAYTAAMQEASGMEEAPGEVPPEAPAVNGAVSGASSHTLLVSDTEASYQQEELDEAHDDAAALGEVEHNVAMMEPESPINYRSSSAPNGGYDEPVGPFAATRSSGAAQYRSSSPMAPAMQLPLPPVRQNAQVRF